MADHLFKLSIPDEVEHLIPEFERPRLVKMIEKTAVEVVLGGIEHYLEHQVKNKIKVTEIENE